MKIKKNLFSKLKDIENDEDGSKFEKEKLQMGEHLETIKKQILSTK